MFVFMNKTPSVIFSPNTD